jgi:hypothetical protein
MNGLAVATELWATATAHERTHDPREVDHGEQLANQVDQWMTPFGMGNVDATGKRGGGGEFAKSVELWPTPVANDDQKTPEAHLAMKQRMGERDGSGANRTAITSLAVMVQAVEAPPSAWPTAGANDHKGSNRPGQRRGQLDEATEHWGTPRVTTNNGIPSPQCTGKGSRIEDQAGEFHSSLPAPATATDGVPSSPPTPTSPRPRLNPCFVAWLMGWPLTALGISGYLEMESSPCKPPTPLCGCGTAWHRRMRNELMRLTGSTE